MADLHKIIVKHEWAYIVTDEDTGLFSAHGSYGTYAYVWPPQHRRMPLHQFLAGLDFDYFIGKTRWLAAREFDFNATKDNIKRHILDARRQDHISKQTARDAMDALEVIDDTNSADYLASQICDDPDIMAVLGDDWHLALRERYTPECVEFWRVIWPAFLATIQPAKEASHG